MGFGLRRKVRYIRAYLEEWAFKHSGEGSACPSLGASDSVFGVWFVDYDELDKEKILLDETELNQVVQHQFDFLGTGLRAWGESIQWHTDIRTGYTWPALFYRKLKSSELTGIDGCDVKIPWELSRFNHIFPVVRAYVATNREDYANEVVNQINNWILANPYCYGVNWTCAMEVAIRSCNWLWCWSAIKDSDAWRREGFELRFTQSIWQHGCYIENNLENEGNILTNHYLSDIVGLLFIAIMFPSFPEASRWLQFAIVEMESCMDVMVYEDGVNYENSLSYQRLVMELFSYSHLLCMKNNIPLSESFKKKLEKMFDFILYCTRPDGKVPMIGDSDDGRLFILSNYFHWDRSDFRYLLAIGAKLFDREDMNVFGGNWEENFWLFDHSIS